MKRLLFSAFVATFAFSFIGCGSGGESADSASHKADGAQTTASKVVASAKKIAADGVGISCEVACAGCIYHMDGVEGCIPAVKMATGETMLLKGVPVDAHGLGLCKAAAKATVSGKVQDGTFVASAVDLDQ